MKTLQIQKWQTLKKVVKDYSVDRIFPADRERVYHRRQKTKIFGRSKAPKTKQSNQQQHLSKQLVKRSKLFSKFDTHKKTTVRQPCVTETKKKKNTETKCNSQNRTFFSARQRVNTQIHTHTISGNTSDGTSERIWKRVKTETTRRVKFLPPT